MPPSHFRNLENQLEDIVAIHRTVVLNHCRNAWIFTILMRNILPHTSQPPILPKHLAKFIFGDWASGFYAPSQATRDQTGVHCQLNTNQKFLVRQIHFQPHPQLPRLCNVEYLVRRILLSFIVFSPDDMH